MHEYAVLRIAAACYRARNTFSGHPVQTSSVTQKGQITVPAGIRRALGIRPGSKVRFTRKSRGVLVETVDEPTVDSLFGVLKMPKGRGVADLDVAIDAAKSKRAAALRRK
jgi:AbrB family looped-hinge helix DNA binding protein